MKTSMKRINGTERGVQPVRPTTLASQGHLPCRGSVAMSLPHPLISIRPQGLAACRVHVAKPSSQHASGWLASGFQLGLHRHLFMNLENQTVSDSLKLEFHALQAMSDSLKLELLENQTMSCSLKIEFHAVQTMSDGLKFELSLSEAMFAYFAASVWSWAVVCISFIHH